jgi:uridylate kinase
MDTVVRFNAQIMKPYSRVVVKVTGEALGGSGVPFDPTKLRYLVSEFSALAGLVELIIVVGGGNIGRGSALQRSLGISPRTADHVGMTATIINALILKDALQESLSAGLHCATSQVVVATAIKADQLAEPFLPEKVIAHLRKKKVVILAAGTGTGGVTTDTAAVLHAHNLGATIMIKGTKVRGVFDRDPNAPGVGTPAFFKDITYASFLAQDLKLLDPGCIALARTHQVPIQVLDIFSPGLLVRAIKGENVGTIISDRPITA